jgi:hypothetical protein
VTAAGVRIHPFESVPAGLKAITGEGHVPYAGLIQLMLFIGILDMGYTSREAEINEVHLKASKWDAKTIERRMAVELNNGRAAMMGISGLVYHECANGTPYIINELLGMHVAM